ncbi:MAG: M28 family peptidase, partial [Flavisolibacter sp.]
MKNVLVLVLALSTLNSFAQKTAKPDAFAKSITPSDLKKRLYIVAAADMQGRETATEGQRKAAAYIESEFKSLGLQPGNKGSYQLFYNVYQDSLVNAKLQVNGEDFQMDKDFNPSVNNIPAIMRFNEVVFVGANAGDSLKNANLAGRAVLIVGGLPQRFGR